MGDRQSEVLEQEVKTAHMVGYSILWGQFYFTNTPGKTMDKEQEL